MEWERLANTVQEYSYFGKERKLKILAVIDGLDPQSHDRSKADIIDEDNPDGKIREWMDERFQNIRDRIRNIRYIN